ncbi:unnamed protein product [Rodentolepis nana]|uniref:Death domain-containing protein n=1 Tax=Rodentolepis nana TaxID=102285 RepID=A0A0R3TND5_RODNA|nr:unnamed protein product [Rodentolepis nana]
MSADDKLTQPSAIGKKTIDCLSKALITRIREYLDVLDLMNVCLVIGGWKGVLKDPAMQACLENYVRNIEWLDGKLFQLFRSANELELCLDKVHSIRYHAAEEKKVRLSRSQSDGLPKTTTTTTTTTASSKCPVYLRLFNKNSISRLLVQWEHDKIINIIERSGFTVTDSHAVSNRVALYEVWAMSHGVAYGDVNCIQMLHAIRHHADEKKAFAF